ncbi:MAG: NusG domain II-containing protein [Clostridia bacterium]|nr:NusG domain II-containing protein [Clostridia bacterium]
MKEKENTVKRYVRNDILLILCLVLIAAIGLFYLYVLRDHGDTVRVTVDGKEYGNYSLSQDITEDIYTGKDGEYHNRLVIKDGTAFMESANCPDGICVEHSRVFRDGESIVCLPHRVVITVVTSGDSNTPDVVI